MPLKPKNQTNSSKIRKIYIYTLEVMIIAQKSISNPPGKTGGDHLLCKEYGCNMQDSFRLSDCAITMTSNLASLSCDVGW